jgi:hypothetical protein
MLTITKFPSNGMKLKTGLTQVVMTSNITKLNSLIKLVINGILKIALQVNMLKVNGKN